MNTNKTQMLFFLIKHNFNCELSAKERILSSLLFAGTILVLFNFAFAGKIMADYGQEVFLAELFITLVLTMQLSFMRQFDLECEDNALESLRINPISSYLLYLAKYFVSLVMATLVMAPTLLLALFFHAASSSALTLNLQFLAVLTLVLAGVCCIGCLISSLTQKMDARESLYPLLFYPLLVPLLIVGIQACYSSLNKPGETQLLMVLLALDVLYFLLSLLLFDEVMN